MSLNLFYSLIFFLHAFQCSTTWRLPVAGPGTRAYTCIAANCPLCMYQAAKRAATSSVHRKMFFLIFQNIRTYSRAYFWSLRVFCRILLRAGHTAGLCILLAVPLIMFPCVYPGAVCSSALIKAPCNVKHLLLYPQLRCGRYTYFAVPLFVMF